MFPMFYLMNYDSSKWGFNALAGAVPTQLAGVWDGGQVGLLGLMGPEGLSGLPTQTRTFYPQKCMNIYLILRTKTF